MISMRLWKHGNGYWYILSEDKEVQKVLGGRQKTLKTKDLQLARKIFSKFEKEYLKGRLIKIDKEDLKLFGDFMNDYLPIRKSEKAWNTYRADRLALNKFLDFYGNRPMVGINSRKLSEFKMFLTGSGLDRASVNNYIRHFKKALKTAMRWGHLKDDARNPLFDEFKQDKIDKRKPVYYEKDDVVECLDAAGHYSKEMQTACAIQFYAGPGRSEMVGTFVISETTISYRRVKTKKLVTVPIGKKLRPYLEHLAPGIHKILPWKNPRTYSEHFDRIMKMVKCVSCGAITQLPPGSICNCGGEMKYFLKRITPHKARHTFATMLLWEGVDLKTIQKLLDHSSINITSDFYAHLTDEMKQAAVDKL